jgi:hypothetical protein
MPKREGGEIPPEIIERLDEAIDRFATQLRQEVSRMFRFANVSRKGQIPREVIAAIMVIEDKGKPMHIDAILEELKGGGIWRPATGAKGSSADTEMRRAISRAATHGVNLKYVDKEKEIIGLGGEFAESADNISEK